jgi:hypothetical protein
MDFRDELRHYIKARMNIALVWSWEINAWTLALALRQTSLAPCLDWDEIIKDEIEKFLIRFEMYETSEIENVERAVYLLIEDMIEVLVRMEGVKS